MIFSCDRGALSEAVGIVQRAVSSHSNIPALEGILIKTDSSKVILTGNNLEIGIECVIEASVDVHGSVVVNSKLFGEIINKFTGDIVTFNCNENNFLNLKCGNSKFKITGVAPDEYPELQKSSQNDTFCINIPAKLLKMLVKNTSYATSLTGQNIVLSGCYFEADNGEASMVGVDGFRLALKKVSSEKISVDGMLTRVGIIIPAKSLNEVTRIMNDTDDEVKIFCSQKNVRFEFENVLFICRTIEGDFIDYNKIIPTENLTTVKANARELQYSVERASLIITNEVGKSPVVLKIQDGEIIIDCETSAGNVHEVVYVEMLGENITIGFNNKFLTEALRAVETDEIIMGFSGSMKPCLIKPVNGDDFKYLVLPVKL